MRNNRLSIILIILFVNIVNSQEINKKSILNNIIIGLNVGGNYSYLHGTTETFKDYKGTINYLAGVSLEFKILNNWSLCTNINYENKSIKYNVPYSPLSINYPWDPQDKIEYNFEQLTIPVFAKYNLNNSFVYITGGVYFTKLINVNYYIDGNKGDLDLTNLYKNDFGISTGIVFIVYQNNNETQNISLELRNNYGLKNIRGDTYDPTKTSKTNTFELILNYNFNL
jgi:hypothetical protein